MNEPHKKNSLTLSQLLPNPGLIGKKHSACMEYLQSVLSARSRRNEQSREVFQSMGPMSSVGTVCLSLRVHVMSFAAPQVVAGLVFL